MEATELAQLLLTHQTPIAILNTWPIGPQVAPSRASPPRPRPAWAADSCRPGMQMVLAMSYSVTVDRGPGADAASILRPAFRRART